MKRRACLIPLVPPNGLAVDLRRRKISGNGHGGRWARGQPVFVLFVSFVVTAFQLIRSRGTDRGGLFADSVLHIQSSGRITAGLLTPTIGFFGKSRVPIVANYRLQDINHTLTLVNGSSVDI